MRSATSSVASSTANSYARQASARPVAYDPYLGSPLRTLGVIAATVAGPCSVAARADTYEGVEVVEADAVVCPRWPESESEEETAQAATGPDIHNGAPEGPERGFHSVA